MMANGATGVKAMIRSIGKRFGLRRWDAEPPAGERDANYYDRYFAEDEGYRRPYYKSQYYPLWTVIADRVRRGGCRKVLEIGCGSGQLAALLLDQGVDQYVGLDFSAQAVDIARAAAPAGRFVVGDARSTTIYDEFDCDVLICTEVLEHIEDDLTVIARFPAGKRCICSVPNFPYESHVRHFDDAAAVAARYGRFFDDPDVLTLVSPKAYSTRYFLLDGRRNGERS